MLKKILAVILTITTLLALGACSLGGDVTTVDTSADTSEIDTSELDLSEEESISEADDASKETDSKDVDIIGFINLDRQSSDNGKLYLTKDDILAFDKQAAYIGAVPEHSYDYTSFTMFIESNDRMMFDHSGYLYYPAKIEASDVIENTEDYSHQFFSPCYKYIGDGSDIPFGSDMMFTIQNATYNDYVEILERIATLANKDLSDVKIIHNDQYKQIKYIQHVDIPEILSIDDYDAVVDNESFELSTQAMYISQSTNYPFYIKADWLSENHFQSNHHVYNDIFPGDDNTLNRIEIRIYHGNEKPAETLESSDSYITGTYTYANEALSNYSSVPSIYFDDDGDCLMFVNYLNGGCNMEGKYYIRGDKIYVKLDFSNTIFEDSGEEYTELDYMSDEYVFTIVNDNEIVIDRGCYIVKAGDSFVCEKSK